MPPPRWYADKVYGPDGVTQDLAHGPEGVYTKAGVVVIVTKDVSSKCKVQVVVDEGGAQARGLTPPEDVQVNILDENDRPFLLDEPVYVLRGSNMLATMVLQMYRDVLAELELEGKDDASAELNQIVAAFEKFEAEHPDAMQALV